MKFPIVEPSPLPILIPLGPKYSPGKIIYKNEIKRNRKVKRSKLRKKKLDLDIEAWQKLKRKNMV